MCMRIVSSLTDEIVATTLLRGGVVFARTDTIYGLLARADDEKAVERVYQLKGRNPEKSPIVLIADTGQLYDAVPQEATELVRQQWPGRVSIILPSVIAPSWIQRHNHSVAYRLPALPELQSLIGRTGPLVAPSANPESRPPAANVPEAVAYFGDGVDIYIDGGEVAKDTPPSRLLRIHADGSLEQLR